MIFQMQYNLTQTQVLQISVWAEDFDKHYSNSDVLVLRDIAQRATSNMFLDESDIYELMEVLPRIIPSPRETPQKNPASQSTDWGEYTDKQRVRYKREMEHLYQMLSTWLFMQSAVYRKNMKSFEKPVGKAEFNSLGKGIKK